MTSELKNNIARVILSYFITFIQTSFIIPVLLVSIAPFIIITIIIQDHISSEISNTIFQTIFIEKTNLELSIFKIYILFSFVLSILIEFINKIRNKKDSLKLKHKLFLINIYFVFIYISIIILFAVFEKNTISIFVWLFMLLISMLYSSFSLSISHGLELLKKQKIFIS